nr:ferritin-like domain-containing protein [Tissierella sp.]
MSQYHEPVEFLDSKALDISRALNSLKEEIEAVDWYNQRVAACSCTELKDIMAHNRDEEIEHAAMTIEWLRRNMGAWDEELKTYLFKEGDITKLEGEAMSGGGSQEAKGDNSSLGIGNLK